jgi:hypothetical protein
MGTLREDLCTFVIYCSVLLRMKMVQIKVVEKIHVDILCSLNFLFRKSCNLWDNMEKYCGTRQAPGDNIIRHRKDAICMPDGRSKRTDTRARARARTHTRTHSHNHYFLLFHSNSGYASGPHRYIIRTYPVLCVTPAVLILKSLRARSTAYFKLGQ